MDDIGEDSNTGELHYLSKKPLTCHDNIYVQALSPCCTFSEWFQSDTIVSPGELELGCKDCGVEPLEGGNAVSVHFTRHEDLHCYSKNFTFRYSQRWRADGSDEFKERTLENITCWTSSVSFLCL